MATSSSDSSKKFETGFVIEESSTEMAWLLNADTILTRGMGGLFSERSDLSGIQAILDIGCGPGGWVLEVAHQHPTIQVTGIDISQPMIRYAQALAESRLLDNVHFAMMDALQPLDLPDQSFDLVNARTLVGIMTPATWSRLLAECRRITRPGGVIRVTEFEAPITNSAAFNELWSFTMRALAKTGRSFSPDGRHIGIINQLGRLIQEAGYQDAQHKAHAIDFSAGSADFEGWYQNFTLVFQLLKPFYLEAGVTTEEKFERLFQQMVGEILAPSFRGLFPLLTVWGVKP